MLWNELIAEAAATLEAAGVPSPLVDARELAEFVAGTRVLRDADAAAREAFLACVERRAARVPLQHITGTMYFRYLTLVSAPGAFIVRPETEGLAGDAIDEARTVVANGRTPRVVDLCTGSGAVAIAVATEVPEAQVLGVDLSDEALAVARENNARYGERVAFVQADARTWQGSEAYDVVVSNPPYVPPTHQLSPEVLADPALALWGGGPEGLDVPMTLLKRAVTLLRPGGLFLMEHAEEQAGALVAKAEELGFSAHTRSDLAGRPRWLAARLEA